MCALSPSQGPTKDEARVFDALGNPVRREIVAMLARRPHAVVEIARALPVSRPAISKHLTILQDAALVEHSAHGTRHLYRLHRKGFAEAQAWLSGFWDEALGRFRMVAENTAPRGDP